MNKKENKKNILISLLIYLVLIALIVFVLNDYQLNIIDNILLYILLAVSLSLTIGFLGQLTLGNAGFMAIGAYTSAMITMNLSTSHIISFPIAILASGIVAGIFGVLIGIPALRLKGDYLAIITLGFGEIIRNIIQNIQAIGGAKGINGIPSYVNDFKVNRYVNFSVIFFLTALTIIIIKNLITSRHGRSIIAIREDEIAAEASGINVTYYKILTFSTTAFFAGIAGALYAHNIGIIEPSKFNFNYSIEIVIMVVLGGAGNILGCIISVIFLTLLSQTLSDFSKYRMLIYSILLISTMLLKNYKPELLDIKYWKNIFKKKENLKEGR